MEIPCATASRTPSERDTKNMPYEPCCCCSTLVMAYSTSRNDHERVSWCCYTPVDLQQRHAVDSVACRGNQYPPVCNGRTSWAVSTCNSIYRQQDLVKTRDYWLQTSADSVLSSHIDSTCPSRNGLHGQQPVAVSPRNGLALSTTATRASDTFFIRSHTKCVPAAALMLHG